MAKDLKNFAKGRGKNVGGSNAKGKGMDDVPEDVRHNVESLQGKSESELMNLLMREIEKGKKDGSFSKGALDDFIAKISPMLGSVEQRRLSQLLGKLH